MIELIKKSTPQYKANLHCHSTLSDGRLTPEELKAAYKNAGYSVLAITDHEYPYDHSAMTDGDFLMLTGYEVYIRTRPDGKYDRYLPEVHINLLARDPHNTTYVGYKDFYCRYVKDEAVRESFKKVFCEREREYTPDYVNAFVKAAKENGYICTHNHAYWSLEDQSAIGEYEGFFSMEMCNYSSYVSNNLEYNAQLYDWLLRKGKRIACHSSDDNHNKAPLDSPRSDSFGGFAMIMADELSYSSVFSALERGEFYSSMGPTIKSLTVDGDSVHIETDPVARITFFDGSKRPQFVIGEDLTSADFTLDGSERYIRLTATDSRGRSAETRGYFPDELKE